MRKTGDEPIKFRGKDTGLRLRDFWSWGFSDLLDNTLRGIAQCNVSRRNLPA